MDDSSIIVEQSSIIIEQSSQLRRMTEHLDALPLGEESVGKLQLVRLMNKKAFLQNQIFTDFLSIATEIIFNIVISSDRRKELIYSQDSLGLIDTLVRDAGIYCESFTNEIKWSSTQSDEMFELFEMDNAPPFVFISHRWAKTSKGEQRPFGLHNELILLLAHASEDYIWLDYSCAPQDQYSLETSKNTLKVIWNITKILDKCTNMMCYYGNDGFRKHQPLPLLYPGDRLDYYINSEFRNEIDYNIENRLTESIFTIYSFIYNSFDNYEDNYKGTISLFYTDSYRSLLASTGKKRLWCTLEYLYGINKIIYKSGDYTKYVQSDDPYEMYCRMYYNGRDEIFKAIHNAGTISLDVYEIKDIFPVTKLLYDNKMISAIFEQGEMPYVKASDGTVTLGFHLPDVQSNNLYGWYKFIIEGSDMISETLDWMNWIEYTRDKVMYCFACNFPASKRPECRSIRLFVHGKCLLKSTSLIWPLPRNGIPHPDFMPKNFKNWKKRKLSCLLCRAPDESSCSLQ